MDDGAERREVVLFEVTSRVAKGLGRSSNCSCLLLLVKMSNARVQHVELRWALPREMGGERGG